MNLRFRGLLNSNRFTTLPSSAPNSVRPTVGVHGSRRGARQRNHLGASALSSFVSDSSSCLMLPLYTRQRWPRTSNFSSVVSLTNNTVGTLQPYAYPTSRYTFGFAVVRSATTNDAVAIRSRTLSSTSPTNDVRSARSHRKPAASAAL
jgi:hypothetical protein